MKVDEILEKYSSDNIDLLYNKLVGLTIGENWEYDYEEFKRFCNNVDDLWLVLSMC
jgi:hypothetical protein